MACSRNFKIKDTHYSNINYKIPCRYCLNCRVDKRKEWETRANYELKTKLSGTFLTCTYDTLHLTRNLVLGNDNKVRATLNYKDIKKFIQRLRKRVQNDKKNQSSLMNPNFTYLGVGEYGQKGELFDRPHWHILFFGLDHKYCEKMFLEEWQEGFIDALPILNGGIRYVLKYMDKQIMGKENKWENFGRYGLEAPKQFQSKGLGNGVYQNAYEEGRIENGVIIDGLKEYQIPKYYKDKMGLFTDKRQNVEKTIDRLQNYWRIKKYENPNKQIMYNKARQIQEEIDRDYQELIERRERKLYQKMLNAS